MTELQVVVLAVDVLPAALLILRPLRFMRVLLAVFSQQFIVT